MKDKMAFRVNASLREIDWLSSKVYEKLVPLVGREKAFKTGLLIIEACTNIVKYGYHYREGDIDVEIGIDQKDVELTISDSGKPFNPLEKSLPDFSRVEEFQDGGMGIYLIRSLSKEVSYRYEDGKNHLKLSI
ncbi:ATP-binding protein [Kosmotoga pacifica]|uniref:Histidine kinase/HSP90-like ATPase domain-containing protein n=1 Tax=Kosmotoga pacifica TaxID=1330330 RepID=A0A0G2ZFA3_9BACT|nr:ATP-binding protein [Kosmotoga pacifica]AKI97448.1 hypothetical protein IX53_06025 [Kosmotoga pacifica]